MKSRAIELIKQRAIEYTVAVILGLFGFLVAKLIDELWVPFFQKILPELSNTTLLTSILILSLCFLISIACVIYLLIKISKKVNLKHYDWIKIPGYFTHRKNGGEFCPRCIFPPRSILSPLASKGHGDLICHNCDKRIKFVSPTLA